MKNESTLGTIIGTLIGIPLGFILVPMIVMFWMMGWMVYIIFVGPFKLIGGLSKWHREAKAERQRDRDRIMYSGWW